MEAQIVFNGRGPQFRLEPDRRLKIAQGERHRRGFGRKAGGRREGRGKRQNASGTGHGVQDGPESPGQVVGRIQKGSLNHFRPAPV